MLATTDFNSNTLDHPTESNHSAEIHHRDMFTDTCSICAVEIRGYIPEYFCGEVVNPACDECKMNANLSEDDHTMDPISSFPLQGIQNSLVSHWIPPFAVAKLNVMSIPSFKAHHVQPSTPVNCYLAREEMLRKMKAFTDEQCRKLEEQCEKLEANCKQS